MAPRLRKEKRTHSTSPIATAGATYKSKKPKITALAPASQPLASQRSGASTARRQSVGDKLEQLPDELLLKIPLYVSTLLFYIALASSRATLYSFSILLQATQRSVNNSGPPRSIE